MRKHERIIEVKFAGAGHYKVTIQRYGKLYSAIITDMPTIDDYKDGIQRAANHLYDEVYRKTSI